MKKLLFLIMILGACTMSCTRTNGRGVASSPTVPLSKYLGLDDLERLCASDSSHHKALLFTNPYCSGCRHELAERLDPLMDHIDTSRWRIYYLLVVDSADTLDYSRFMADCSRAGIDTVRAYIWRHYSYAEDYNRLAVQKMVSLDDPTDTWYTPMDLDPHALSLDDFSTEDTAWYLLAHRSKPQFACAEGVCR